MEANKTVIEHCVHAHKEADGIYFCSIRRSEELRRLFDYPCATYCDYTDDEGMRHCPYYIYHREVKED